MNATSTEWFGMDTKAPYRILLVEDDHAIAQVIALSLRYLGDSYLLDQVISAEEGLDLWQKESYDIVLTDYNLRGTNGVHMLHQIREQGSEVPAILFTAFDTSEIRAEADHAGAHYLPKPFLMDEIVNLTRKLLRITEGDARMV